METVLQVLQKHLYGAVFLGIFLETAGFPLPGEVILLTVGALSASGSPRLAGVIAIGAIAALSGDFLLFLLGRKITEDRERRLVRFYCRWTYCALGSRYCHDQARGLIRRFDARALIFGKFIVGVRQFMAPVAGMARVSPLRFAGFDAVGSALWVTTVSLLGFVFHGELTLIFRVFLQFKAVVMVVLFALAFAFLVRRAFLLVRSQQTAPPDAS